MSGDAQMKMAQQAYQAAEPVAAPARGRRRKAAASEVPGNRVMIVDDEPANARLLEVTLGMQGYTELAVTTDPRQALATFAAFQPDLVLLDLHMPALDGFAVMSELRRQLPADHYLPILVVTGDTTPQVKERALSSGATDFLVKPFDSIELVLRIRNLLQTRALHAAVQRQNRVLEARVRERTAELEVALRQAEAAREAKVQFLAKMSHELRTPLNPIRGALELLREAAADLPEAPRRLLAMASSNTDRMVALINDILYLQSIEQEEVALAPAPLQLGSLLQRVVERAEPQLRGSPVSVTLECPPQLAPLHADAERLEDVLSRLLENAVRFTPEGEITLRAVAERRTCRPLRIEIADPGIGIPADRIESIFLPFEQADNSNTRRYEGAGIGLSICRALCQLMGYRLEVVSEVGRGSTFVVVL